MLSRNSSQQSLHRSSARISLSRKLPSDFFIPLSSSLNKYKKSSIINQRKQNKQTHRRSIKRNNNTENNINVVNLMKDQNNQSRNKNKLQVSERKLSFQFTFYNGVGNNNNMQKSSKMISVNKEKQHMNSNINNINNNNHKISHTNLTQKNQFTQPHFELQKSNSTSKLSSSKLSSILSSYKNSTKKQIYQKFNIKLPFIRSAESGVQRRKKLYKVSIGKINMMNMINVKDENQNVEVNQEGRGFRQDGANQNFNHKTNDKKDQGYIEIKTDVMHVR